MPISRGMVAEKNRFCRFNDIWEMMRRAMFTDKNFEIVDKVGRLAAKLGTTHAAVAVAWTLARPGVTSAIIGPRSVEQLEDNLAAVTLTLDTDALKDLDRVSRGQLTYLGFLARGTG